MVQNILVFKKQKFANNSNYYRIRVTGEAYEKIEEISKETNISLNEVATKMILFAAEYSKVEGV